ncbi:MAG: hypothetical protein R3B96_08620 [Pirellulaceae bacterium]
MLNDSRQPIRELAGGLKGPGPRRMCLPMIGGVLVVLLTGIASAKRGPSRDGDAFACGSEPRSVSVRANGTEVEATPTRSCEADERSTEFACHFRPADHALGDVHPFFHEGVCYLFYLKPGDYESALVTSRDLLHWTAVELSWTSNDRRMFSAIVRWESSRFHGRPTAVSQLYGHGARRPWRVAFVALEREFRAIAFRRSTRNLPDGARLKYQRLTSSVTGVMTTQLDREPLSTAEL